MLHLHLVPLLPLHHHHQDQGQILPLILRDLLLDGGEQLRHEPLDLRLEEPRVQASLPLPPHLPVPGLRERGIHHQPRAQQQQGQLPAYRPGRVLQRQRGRFGEDRKGPFVGRKGGVGHGQRAHGGFRTVGGGSVRRGGRETGQVQRDLHRAALVRFERPIVGVRY